MTKLNGSAQTYLRAFQALNLLLWIVVIWLGYATLDGLIHLHRDSRADLLKVDFFATVIFAGLATLFLFFIGAVRGKLARQEIAGRNLHRSVEHLP